MDPLTAVDYPEMGLKLKQGCGRLIRRSDDRGVITILEPVRGMPWEKYALEALPAGARQVEDLADLSVILSQFIHPSQNNGIAVALNGNTKGQEGSRMKIEKVKKNAEGDITDLMIEGNIYSIDKAIEMAKGGMLEGFNVARARNGREFLRSNPDGSEANNLDNLPQF